MLRKSYEEEKAGREVYGENVKAGLKAVVAEILSEIKSPFFRPINDNDQIVKQPLYKKPVVK